MSNKHGDFIWYELLTADAEAAQEFYGAVVGWSFADSGTPDMDYRLFSAAESQIGGVMPLTDEMTTNGARPCWLGYIAVDDVDASAAAIKVEGGSLHMGPQDLPDVGRIALVTDPQGTMFYIMKDTSGNESASFAAAEPKVGHCAWNELMSSNPAAAKEFYEAQFGWHPNGDMDMGPMGKYEFWKVGDARGHMIGAVMPKPEEVPVSAWTYYFRVPDIDAAVETIKTKGGQVLHEPTEIPGGEFQLNGTDPQGAFFALVGPRK